MADISLSKEAFFLQNFDFRQCIIKLPCITIYHPGQGGCALVAFLPQVSYRALQLHKTRVQLGVVLA